MEPGEGGVGVQVSVAGRTDTGRVRAENQDALLYVDLARGAAPASGRFELTPEGAILLVADGMGGALGGATASRMAVSKIEAALVASPGPVPASQADAPRGSAPEPGPETARGSGSGFRPEAVPERTPEVFAARLRDALHSANAAIHQEARQAPGYQGMGTTATLAGLLGRAVYVAQVGDSRAYLVRGGSALQLTRDQSVVQEFIDAGVMTEEEAEESVHRNTILQALGVAETIRPELTFHELRRGDVILLCSDGLSRVVRDAEMAAAAAETEDPETLCRQLVELANVRGAPDNVTVVVARVEGEALEPPGPADTMKRKSYPPQGEDPGNHPSPG